MSIDTLTTDEAEILISMLKESLIEQLNFPLPGKKASFDVVGENKTDVFTINIERGNINPNKLNIGARISKNNIMLLELHLSPTQVHPNPDGTKIRGSHWHIYKEGYGLRWAFPADDLNGNNFVDNTVIFLEKFHVVKQPEIQCSV